MSKGNALDRWFGRVRNFEPKFHLILPQRQKGKKLSTTSQGAPGEIATPLAVLGSDMSETLQTPARPRRLEKWQSSHRGMVLSSVTCSITIESLAIVTGDFYNSTLMIVATPGALTGSRIDVLIIEIASNLIVINSSLYVTTKTTTGPISSRTSNLFSRPVGVHLSSRSSRSRLECPPR